MKLSKLVTILGFSVGLLMTAGATNAALLSFEDDDIDFHLREDGNGDLQVVSGQFAVGDVLVAAFEIDPFAIDGANAIPAGQELTGVSAIEIKDFNAPFGGINFQPYAGGLNAVLGLGTSGNTVADGDAGEGAMLAMWFNGAPGAAGDRDLDLNRTSNPASNCTSISDCITQASLGDLFQVDGFKGDDSDEFWISNALIGNAFDSSIVAGLNNNLLVAGFNAGLSTFFHNGPDVEWINIVTGLPCGDVGPAADGCVQLTISGTITGGQGLSNGAFAHSDFDGQKITVPEPGMLALLGIGFMGMGLFSRKKSTKA